MRNKNPVPAAITERVMKTFLYVFLSFQSTINKLTRLPKSMAAKAKYSSVSILLL